MFRIKLLPGLIARRPLSTAFKCPIWCQYIIEVAQLTSKPNYVNWSCHILCTSWSTSSDFLPFCDECVTFVLNDFHPSHWDRLNYCDYVTFFLKQFRWGLWDRLNYCEYVTFVLNNFHPSHWDWLNYCDKLESCRSLVTIRGLLCVLQSNTKIFLRKRAFSQNQCRQNFGCHYVSYLKMKRTLQIFHLFWTSTFRM